MLRSIRTLLKRFRPWGVSGDDISVPAPEDGLVSQARTAAGVTIHVDPQDKRGQQLARSGGNMNPRALAMWMIVLRRQPWTHLVDVGANYGEMLVNGGLPAGARIVAIEPSPDIRLHLKRTLADAGIQAEIIDAAVSDSAGSAGLIVDQQWSGITRLAEPGDDKLADHQQLIQVPTVAFSDVLCGLGDPSRVRAAIKLDIEGREIAVLRSAVDSLQRLQAFGALIEVEHVSKADLAWLMEHFAVEAYNIHARRLETVIPATGERLTELLASKDQHPTDVVLSRRTG